MSTGKTGTFCTRVSKGCAHCYASVINTRFGTGAEFTVPNLADHEFFLNTKMLDEPLKRKKPATIFFGDMYDGWHESIPDALIDRVMAIAALSPWHVYQGLTKRAERMYGYFSNRATPYRIQRQIDCILVDQEMAATAGAWMKSEAPYGDEMVTEIQRRRSAGEKIKPIGDHFGIDKRKVSQIANSKTYKTADLAWPLPNVWLGVSVEDQQRANERIPLLTATPARVRFLSIEPQLEAVDISPWTGGSWNRERVDWVICGGESGPGARPFFPRWPELLLGNYIVNSLGGR
jgi:protein gp37